MSEKQPLISIVIPVKNGEYWMDKCLSGIMSQTLFPQCEVIIIDSGSTDKTLEILKSYPVKVVSIEPETFNHGLTRNLGVANSCGKYIVMTVQDAVAADNMWLQHMLDGFSTAENVAAVCGKQVVPHDKDKNPAEWYRPVGMGEITSYSFSKEAFLNLSPAEKRSVCGWDDVTAMYLRDVLVQIPFRKTSFAEDAQWAKDAYMNGYTLVYNTNATVYHYHYENPDYTYKRTFTVLYHMYRFFGNLPEIYSPGFIDTLKLVKLLLNEAKLSFAEKIKWFRYNQKLRAVYAKVIADFLKIVKQGDEALDKQHELLCGVPPVAPAKY